MESEVWDTIRHMYISNAVKSACKRLMDFFVLPFSDSRYGTVLALFTIKDIYINLPWLYVTTCTSTANGMAASSSESGTVAAVPPAVAITEFSYGYVGCTSVNAS